MAAILWLPARHRHLHQGGEADKDDADIDLDWKTPEKMENSDHFARIPILPI